MSSNSGSSGGNSGFVPPTIDELNSVLKQYEFLSVLGQGGMGAVYKARQISLDRFAAIKILPAELHAEEGEDEMQFAARFQREARAMAKLSHPNIIAVYDFGSTSDGQFYIVMEYVEGTDLYTLLQTGGLTTDHVCGWISQMCDALQYAHEQGVVHRDIKPANIMISVGGDVKIADFGLAKLTDNESSEPALTMTNVAMGTPDYVAPEALDSTAEVDHRADLYAVGVMLYEMLTGKVPRGAWKSCQSQVEGLDPRYDKVVLLAMDSDPESRFQSAAEIRSSIYEISTGPSTDVVPEVELGEPHSPESRVKFQDITHFDKMPKAPSAEKPKKGLFVSFAAVALILLIGAVSFLALLKEENPETTLESGGTLSGDESSSVMTPGDETVNGVGEVSASKTEHVETDEARLPSLPQAAEFSSEGFRYQLIPGRVEWSEAKALASEEGGRLAVFASVEEFEKVLPELEKTVSTGGGLHLGARFENGSFLWVDGTEGQSADYLSLMLEERPKFNGSLMAVRESSGGNELGWRVAPLPIGKFEYRPIGYLVQWPVEPKPVEEEPEEESKKMTSVPSPEGPKVEEAEKNAPAPISGEDAEEAGTETMAESNAGVDRDMGDPFLAKLREGFESRYKTDVEAPFLASLKQLETSYISNGIVRARAGATRKGDLEEVNALEEAKARMERGEGVPEVEDSSLPESLRSLNNIFRQSLSKLEEDRNQRAAPLYEMYTGALDGYIAELTRKSEIEKAREVLELRDKIASGGVAAGAVRTSDQIGLATMPSESGLSDEVMSGPLRAFSNVTSPQSKPMDTSKAEKYSDFTSVVALMAGDWAAVRSGGEVVSNIDDFDGLRGAKAVYPGGYIHYKNGNLESINGSARDRIRDVIKVAAGARAGIALTVSGEVHSLGELADAPEGIGPIKHIGITWGGAALAIDMDGIVHLWGEDPSRFELPSGGADFVEVEAGWRSFLALKDDGSVTAWPSVEVPSDARQFISIRASGVVYAGQREDLSWMAWGSPDMGVRDKINEIGPAYDLSFQANGLGFGYLLWIEANSDE
ncbi:MAG: protein kinase [Verrucomicrobiales bacterium]|nr:protein kinase [Verrucomicrobiales bacterium]